MSKCTIGLLLAASQVVYRLGGQNQIDHSIDDKARFKAMPVINSSGYRIEKTISPHFENKGGLGKTPLSAIRLIPKDKKSPIVISYRGTKTTKDMIADIKIAITGTIGANTRKEAYKFYLRTLKKYPNREIIITGHSLGGHIAQYVGTRAFYNNKLPKNLLIRTFNTAPTKTRYGEIFKKIQNYEENFLNYRLNTDIVSKIPLQNYYGSTFDFFSNIKSSLNSHQLWALNEQLPSDILNQRLGAYKNNSIKNNELQEILKAMKESYRCNIQSGFFFLNIFKSLNQQLKKYLFQTINILIQNSQFKITADFIENKILTPYHMFKIFDNLTDFINKNQLIEARDYLKKNKDLIYGQKPRQLLNSLLAKLNEISEKNPSILFKNKLVEHKNNNGFFKQKNIQETEEKSNVSLKNK